jgi:hypothetical protein
VLPHLVTHARKRMAQRGIGLDALALVLRHGRRVHAAGAWFVFLGYRDVPRRLQKELEALVGTTVVLDPTGQLVLTCYRNRDAARLIRRKRG